MEQGKRKKWGCKSDLSKLMVLFRIYGLSGFWFKEKNQKFSKVILLWKFKAIDRDLDWNQAHSYGEFESTLIALFGIFRLERILMQETKSTIFQRNCLPQVESFRFVLLEQSEFQHQANSLIIALFGIPQCGDKTTMCTRRKNSEKK